MDHIASVEQQLVSERMRKKLNEVNMAAQAQLAPVQDHINFTLQVSLSFYPNLKSLLVYLTWVSFLFFFCQFLMDITLYLHVFHKNMISLGYLIRFGKWVLLNSCLGIVRIKLRLEGKALNFLIALVIKCLCILFYFLEYCQISSLFIV